MTFTRLILALSTLVFGAATAQAQNPTLIKPKAMVMERNANRDPDLQRKAMVQWAECSLKSRRQRVMEYLSLFPSSQDAHKKLRSIADTDCIGDGFISYNEPLFRGATYQFLYADTYRNQPVTDLAYLASPDYASGAGTLSQADGHQIALRRYADCVARANPQAVHELLVIDPASPKEPTAFAAVMPGLSSCLAKGDTLSFSKSILRGALAEVMYRIRTDAKPAAAKAEG